MSFKNILTPLVLGSLVLLCQGQSWAANVNAGTGYTNDFSIQPTAADWTTRSFATGTALATVGEITTASGLNSAVQTNSASLFSAQCTSATGSPANGSGTAVWNTSGYLQTRPTAVAATLLMARFVNSTGTNAATVHINYDYSTVSVATEEVVGQLVYYSLTGADNTWSNITALSQASQGTLSVDVVLSGVWSNGATLYLLWADDNGSGSPDTALQIDNFFISVTAPAIMPAYCTLSSPTNGQSFGAVAAITLSASAAAGEEATLTGVGFYDVTHGFLDSVLTAPYSIVANFEAGTYNLYAVATNSLGAVIFSATNTITVTNVPFAVALATPSNGASYGSPATVSLLAEVNPGTGASAQGVGFYDVASGFLANALNAPFGNAVALSSGTYSIYAVATNSFNAIVFSTTNTITITNVPLSVAMVDPENGGVFSVERPIVCQAAPIPGSSGTPIDSVSFYIVSNGVVALLFTDTTAPYSNQVSSLPEGNYGIFAMVANAADQTAVSATNTITVLNFITGTITRGPYLGSRGETNINIRWRTGESSVGRVRFGTSPGYLTAYADEAGSGTDHSVTLTGLAPETKYYYSLGTPSGTLVQSTNFYFTTAPPIGSVRSTRIWFLSDYGQGDSMETAVRDTYVNYITTNGRGTDVWLTGGDNEQFTMTGADSAYQTNTFNVLSNVLQNTPIFPTPGNHDGGSSSAYWTIFDVPSEGQAGGYPSGSAHYYSFDYANIHFISLDPFNSATDASSQMLMWLTNDLAQTAQKWIIAYFHAPIYCKVYYDSDTLAQSLAMRTNFVPFLEARGVDLVISGHSHTLQRSYLLSGHYGLSSTFSETNKIDGGNGRIDGTGAYVKTNGVGTVYTVAPTACKYTRSSSTTHPACIYTVNNTAGFITIDVNTNRLDFKMISSTGAVSDYFTILKPETETVANPIFAAVSGLTNGVCTLVIEGPPGETFTLQYTDNLNDPWQKRMNITIPSEAVLRVQDDATVTGNRFYRLIYPAQ